MVSRFFLDRPVFAWVIAIVMMSAGALAIRFLPVSRYPDLAPPTIMVMAYYPGASAETVENAVTQVIESRALIRMWHGPRCRTSSSSPWPVCRRW